MLKVPLHYQKCLSDGWIPLDTPIRSHLLDMGLRGLCPTICVYLWHRQCNICTHFTFWLASFLLRSERSRGLKLFSFIFDTISVPLYLNNTTDVFYKRHVHHNTTFGITLSMMTDFLFHFWVFLSDLIGQHLVRTSSDWVYPSPKSRNLHWSYFSSL